MILTGSQHRALATLGKTADASAHDLTLTRARALAKLGFVDLVITSRAPSGRVTRWDALITDAGIAYLGGKP